MLKRFEKFVRKHIPLVVVEETPESKPEQLCQWIDESYEVAIRRRIDFEPDVLVLSKEQYETIFVPGDTSVEEDSKYVPMSGNVNFSPPREYRVRPDTVIMVTWSKAVDRPLLMEGDGLS